MQVYVDVATLKADVAPNGPSGLAERLAEACWMGSRYVDACLGNVVGDEPVEPPIADLLVRVPCDPSWAGAAKAAAAYYYKLVDAPMGYIGGLAEYAVKLKPGAIPTADAWLHGQTPVRIA